MKASLILGRVLLAGSLLFCLTTCKHSRHFSGSGIDAPEGRVMDFARSELEKYLQKADSALAANHQKNTRQWQFKMSVDTMLRPYSFAVRSDLSQSNQMVTLSGHDSTCVLHAVYTMLERIGFRFEITGPVISASGIRPDSILNFNVTINPAVLNRGIRQHLNFPMDLSGYQAKDAREYIRNLARMRFNTICFHSYPGQWIEEPELAGNFFYGQRYDIPDNILVKNFVHNTGTFCIPEVEPYLDQKKKRSDMAIQWLREVMDECKRAGLRVQFSFEPYSISHDIQKTVTTCERILKTYPAIDNLELITSETGEWFERVPKAQNQKVLESLFGKEILLEKSVTAALELSLPNFGDFFKEISFNVASINAYRAKHGQSSKPVSFGIYCVVMPWLDAALTVARKYLPADVKMGLMPAHSSQRVANYMGKLDFDKAGWQRTCLYSWIEFDGIMYIQQNGIRGIRMLLEKAGHDLNGDPLYGLCFNHWRTAENRTTARYAALSALQGPIRENDFYRQYCLDLGIGNPGEYEAAMNLLTDADWKSTNALPNFGFCYFGCWLQHPDPRNPDLNNLGYIGVWQPDTIRKVKNIYMEVLGNLQQCRVNTKNAEGLRYLDLLENRIKCTIAYFIAFEKGEALRPLFTEKAPEDFTGVEKQQVEQICDETLTLLDDYMRILSKDMPDRGAEGTLVSFYHTVPAYIKVLRRNYGHGTIENTLMKVKEKVTPPPAKENTEAPHAPIKEK
jgi:hypothetical protein